MNSEIICALIAAGASILVSTITMIATNSKNRQVIKEETLKHQMQIEQLTKEVEKHNNVIERTYKLEERMELNDERLKVANHRIEDLEKKLEK